MQQILIDQNLNILIFQSLNLIF